MAIADGTVKRAVYDSFGVMLTGWQTISGNTYYFNSSGAMVTGRQIIGGKTYTFSSSGALM